MPPTQIDRFIIWNSHVEIDFRSDWLYGLKLRWQAAASSRKRRKHGTSFGPDGWRDHDDDWSSSSKFAATASINGETHMLFLECARYASVEMVFTSVHNYTVARLAKFSFGIKIPNTYEDDLMSELVVELIEIEITLLVSHNRCLHPVGEACCCSDSDGYAFSWSRFARFCSHGMTVHDLMYI